MDEWLEVKKEKSLISSNQCVEILKCFATKKRKFSALCELMGILVDPKNVFEEVICNTWQLDIQRKEALEIVEKEWGEWAEHL